MSTLNIFFRIRKMSGGILAYSREVKEKWEKQRKRQRKMWAREIVSKAKRKTFFFWNNKIVYFLEKRKNIAKEYMKVVKYAKGLFCFVCERVIFVLMQYADVCLSSNRRKKHILDCVCRANEHLHRINNTHHWHYLYFNTQKLNSSAVYTHRDATAALTQYTHSCRTCTLNSAHSPNVND